MNFKSIYFALVIMVMILQITYGQSTYTESVQVEYDQSTDPQQKLNLASQLYIELHRVDSIRAEMYLNDAELIKTEHPTINLSGYHTILAYQLYQENDLPGVRRQLKTASSSTDLTPLIKGHIAMLKGAIHMDQKKLRKSQKQIQQAITEYVTADYQLGLGHAYTGLGNIARRSKKRSIAYSNYDKAITSYRSAGDMTSMLMPMNNIGSLLLKEKKTEESLAAYNEILDIISRKNIKAPTLETHTKNQLAKIYELQNNPSLAKDLKDDILSYQLDSTIEDNTSKFIFTKTDGAQVKKRIAKTAKDWQGEISILKVKQLETENKLIQSRVQNQRLLVGGAILSLLLIGFYAHNIRNKNKHIASQNKIIQSSLTEKETLLKEIHHRVKNNLQVVSSLLRIQSNETTDEVAIEALKEGQARVQSMSLIHQSLYQKDDLTGIRMKVYIEQLTRSLFNTYNISDDRIRLQTNIDDINLDIETVVPLGLIINELITNSLKYAFPNDQRGLINVSLRDDDNILLLEVSDDGIGYEENNNNDKPSFGTGLIQAFSNKLDADMSISSDLGTTVKIKVKEYKII